MSPEPLINHQQPIEGIVFKHYQSNIGLITPHIAEQLGMFIDEYPQDWITEAIDISVENNVRKLSYIKGILDRWGREGKKRRKASIRDTFPERSSEEARKKYQEWEDL